MSQYRTGTVSVTNGSATVTGSGTSWLAEVAANDWFVVSGVKYEVSGVASDTSLTLTANYGGTTGSGLSYVIHRDFVDGFPLMQDGDLETVTLFNQIITAISENKTTASIDQYYTATVSTNTLTVTPKSGIFPTLADGVIVRLILPTYTSTGATSISFNGTVDSVKWINGTATASDDIDSTYNKELWLRFNGTDWLIISDVSGDNSSGGWTKFSNGDQVCRLFDGTSTTAYLSDGKQGITWTFPKTFSSSSTLCITGSVRPLTSNDFYGLIFLDRTVVTPTIQARFVFRNGATAQSVSDYDFIASGRWY